MTGNSETAAWTTKQVRVLAIICAILGGVVGFLAHGPAVAVQASRAVGDGNARPAATVAPPTLPSPSQMKAASARAATPLLEQLKERPSDFRLLVQVGEMYYQHGSYTEAAAFYQRALEIQDNTAVRNQYASAMFYNGDADGALRQYEQVLKNSPRNEIALFNSGMIKFKAKNDPTGALELWQKLLRTYPNHPQRDRVQRMIARASESRR